MKFPAIRQSVIYQHPKTGGVSMPDSDVAAKFKMVIYSRSRMLEHLTDYKEAGWNGLALLYLDMPKAAGASGMSSVAAQKTLSTPAQRAAAVYSNTITMDVGEFCKIHDAIINATLLDGLAVTENWFLHKTDGSRYEEVGGGASQYRMNFANVQYQEYYVHKLEREFSPTDPAHLPTGAQGLFLDDINESWNDVTNLNGGQPPVEFANRSEYQAGILAFLSAIRNAYSFPIWGNMTTLESGTAMFNAFKPYLDGAMIEGAFLDWDGSPLSAAEVVSENEVADAWGKGLLYVVQGDAAETHHRYTFGLYLLMSSANAYFYFTDQTTYANYYDLKEYQVALGRPLTKRYEVSSGVWRRQFQNGTVTVNMNTHKASDVRRVKTLVQ